MLKALTCALAAVLASAAAAGAARAQDAIRFDFETGDLQGWRVAEGRFAQIVCDKAMYRNRPKLPYNKQGRFFLTTLELPNGKGNARLVGVVESPVFVLHAPKVSLLVGGGSHHNTYAALCTLDGKEVLKAHGRNTEVFRRVEWDAAALVGKRVFVRVVDGHASSWGYLAVDDVVARGRIDPDATKRHAASRRPILAGLRADPPVGRPARARPAPLPIDPKALRTAVLDLIATFGDEYPDGPRFLERLGELGKTPDAKSLAALAREALIANPLVSGQPILFITRRQYANNHGTEATMCQTGEINTRHFRAGGAVKALDLARGGAVSALLSLPHGVARDPDVSFDGGRILFSMRRDIRDDYHLYEMSADGSALRQLTFAPRVSDIQPTYMPGGQIVFSSTREPKYIPCQRHLMANLFTMNGDGTNIRQLGHNTQFEGRASLMPDGRILYTRWEYVDKHFAPAYGLWTANPDGTNQALYYGGYAWQPSAIVDARIIPGTERFVAVFTAVHELAWGAMVVADRRRGLDGTTPILRSWPADLTPYMRQWSSLGRIGGGYDSFRGIRVKYQDPYPLSEKHFLCSRSLGPAAQGDMGLFLVDVFGNEVLLHHEAPGCFDPMPLAPRARPPVVAPRSDLAHQSGTFYVQDVYVGDFMDRVARGTVKRLRVVEAPAKLTYPPGGIGDWTPGLDGDAHHPVAVNWNHYNTKRVLGTVPVEPDGSACFTVPAGRFVHFQLLDERGMMVHSMRSGTSVQPGEAIGCVGCHENRLTALPMREAPRALLRPPSTIRPWHGAPRDFSYCAEVQPVLDRHCVRCHDYGTEGGKAILLCGDRGPAFSVSYSSLLARSPAVWHPPADGEKMPLVSTIGSGPVQVVPPYSWGSHRSRLVHLLRKGHYDVKLDPESLDRIVTWIDLNTPYYATYAARYATHTFGRCPLDHTQLARLGHLVSEGPKGAALGWRTVNRYSGGRLSRLIMTLGSPINFTRPEHSLCLQAFTDAADPRRREALELIRAGKDMLARHPRADMPGFRPCEADQRRLDYHAARQAIEARSRDSIVRGQKTQDERP